MRPAISVLLALSLVLVCATTQAKTYPHDPAKVKVDIPGSWKVETGED
ncbi:MAG: hypothetical protein GY913_16540, partial [Proteobacteria bacterium]|nr:hypothetical protein [Pseudomonadota bacterium]